MKDPRTNPEVGCLKVYDNGDVYAVDSVAPFRYSMHAPARLPNVGGTTVAEWSDGSPLRKPRWEPAGDYPPHVGPVCRVLAGWQGVAGGARCPAGGAL